MCWENFTLQNPYVAGGITTGVFTLGGICLAEFLRRKYEEKQRRRKIVNEIIDSAISRVDEFIMKLFYLRVDKMTGPEKQRVVYEAGAIKSALNRAAGIAFLHINDKTASLINNIQKSVIKLSNLSDLKTRTKNRDLENQKLSGYIKSLNTELKKWVKT